MNIGDIIQFRYKGKRLVKGEIIQITGINKFIQLKLHTDYIGKNEDWYESDVKWFNKSEIKKMVIVQTKTARQSPRAENKS